MSHRHSRSTHPVRFLLVLFVLMLLPLTIFPNKEVSAATSFRAEKVVTVASVLVDDTTSGYYNDALGTILDGTQPDFPRIVWSAVFLFVSILDII
jgi:hypothetical protein